MRYFTRNHAFTPATTWEIAGATLRQSDDRGPPRMIPWCEVKQVRLEFAPTRPEPNRLRCRLTLAGGSSVECYNRTYRGIYDFADTSAEYGEFVRALHGTLAREAPGCRFSAGTTRANYLLGNGCTVFAGHMVLIVAGFFLSKGLGWLVLIKLGLMAIFVPGVLQWLARNKPRPYDPAAIPTKLLPASETGVVERPTGP